MKLQRYVLLLPSASSGAGSRDPSTAPTHSLITAANRKLVYQKPPFALQQPKYYSSYSFKPPPQLQLISHSGGTKPSMLGPKILLLGIAEARPSFWMWILILISVYT